MTKAQMLHRVVMEARVHPNGMIEIPAEVWNAVCEAGAKLTLGECKAGDIVRGPGIGDFCVINSFVSKGAYTTSDLFSSDEEVTDVISYA